MAIELKTEREWAGKQITDAESALARARAYLDRVAAREARLNQAVANEDECVVPGYFGLSRGTTYEVARIVRATKTQIIVEREGGREERYRKENLRLLGGRYGDVIEHVHPKWLE